MRISRRKFILSSFFGLGAIGFQSFAFERFFIDVKTFDLGTRVHNSLPLKILQISDLHLKSMGWPMENLTTKVKSLKPDLLFFTGDTIDYWGNTPLLEKFLEMIGNDIPKFCIMGNREYYGWVDKKEYRKVWQKYNGNLLINDSVLFSSPKGDLLITGVDDRVAGNSDFVKAVEGIRPHPNHIILNHSPVYRENIQEILFHINLNKDEHEKFKPDYILAGHTHGGQINILGFAPYLPIGSGKYLYGWYKDFYPQMFVSKGVGTSFLPIRFGARAEIVLFNYYLK